jgi:hypothetical protein
MAIPLIMEWVWLGSRVELEKSDGEEEEEVNEE